MGRTKAGQKPKKADGEADGEKPGAKFRIHRNKVGLTWSCPTDKDENPIFEEMGKDTVTVQNAIRDHFFEKYGQADYIVAEEQHESGKKHYHAHFKFYQKLDVTDPRAFDLCGVHPNILNPGKGWPGYCAKDKQYVTNFYEAEPFAEALRQENAEDALSFLWNKRPREMCIHGTQISTNIRKRMSGGEMVKADHSLEVMCKTLRQHPIEWTHPDWQHCAVVQGNAGCGKTQWALAHFERPLLVTHLDGFRNFNPLIHDGIVTDDLSFIHMPVETQIQITDWEQSRDIHGRNVCAYIPKHTRKIFTCNWGRFPFAFDDAVMSRVCHIELDKDLPCRRKRPPPRKVWDGDEEEESPAKKARVAFSLETCEDPAMWCRFIFLHRWHKVVHG